MRASWRGRRVVAGLVVAVYLVLPAVAGYDVSDFSGVWSVHGVVSGVDPNVPGTFHMNVTADSNGTAQGFYYSDSQGISETTWAGNTPVDLSLSPGGIVTVDGDETSFHGAMSWDEDIIVSVGTQTPGPATGLDGYNLWMWVRQLASSSFSVVDGAGTWWLHGLASGANAFYWSRGKMEIDAVGNFTFVDGTWALSDDPDANTPEDGSISITGTGEVGFSFDPAAHGIMNLSKDLVVFTMPGSSGGHLSILQKRSGATFSTTDLAGTWHLYGLTAGDESVWIGWFYGTLEVGSSGTFSGSIVDSGETETIDDAFSITSDGTVAILGDSNTHGTMSDDKNLIVMTLDDGGGGADLVILTRAVVASVHRFWSPVFLNHFYTISETEKNHVITTWPDSWTYEGIEYYGFPQDAVDGLQPIYRFWSDQYNGHFYTMDEAEKDNVIATWPDVWSFEGTAFYGFPDGAQPDDATPVWRFWSPSLLAHFYTATESEKDFLIDTPDWGWNYECIAWYGYD